VITVIQIEQNERDRVMSGKCIVSILYLNSHFTYLLTFSNPAENYVALMCCFCACV